MLRKSRGGGYPLYYDGESMCNRPPNVDAKHGFLLKFSTIFNNFSIKVTHFYTLRAKLVNFTQLLFWLKK